MPVINNQMTLGELTADIEPEELRELTNEMIDKMQELIVDCEDSDVTFVSDDPDAYDGAAAANS